MLFFQIYLAMSHSDRDFNPFVWSLRLVFLLFKYFFFSIQNTIQIGFESKFGAQKYDFRITGRRLPGLSQG